MLACSLLFLAACGRAPAPATVDATLTPKAATERLLDEAFVLDQMDKKTQAIAAFDAAITSKGFDQLPKVRRVIALEAEGEAEETLQEHANAHALFVRASELDPSNQRAWMDRLESSWETRDYVDNVRCITVIARSWPEVTKEIPGQSIWMVQQELPDDQRSEALRFEMFDALYDAHWRGIAINPSAIWRDLSRMLLARNHLAKAKQVAAEIDRARVVLSMRVDKRFDAITRDNPAFDVDHVATAYLEKTRAKVTSQPDNLQARTEEISALMDLRRYEEALQTADALIATVEDGSGPKRFKDFDEHYNWLLNLREHALVRLGRFDEAAAELERAAGQLERGHVNVSQVINLGELYDELGRPADALAIVSKVGDASPFGKMQLAFVQLWASIQLQKTGAVAQQMDYLRAHRADAMSTWTDALVLTGNDDEAAAEIIARLNNEHFRSQALEDVQDSAPIRRLPLASAVDARWHRVYARADVREAIQKVGRMESFRIDPSAF